MTEERGERAASRRASAEHRSRELRELGERLRSGEPVSEADVELARRRAADAVHHDLDAHEGAATAHARSAERHRDAAQLADSAGHSERAEEHRRAAEADDASAEEQRALLRARRADEGGR